MLEDERIFYSKAGEKRGADFISRIKAAFRDRTTAIPVRAGTS
jgi:hypothetical protein